MKELLQSPFLQRAAAEGVVPRVDGAGTKAAAVATDGGASERVLKEDADLPKLTSLVQSLQDDELTVTVLKIVSSIVAEATYAHPPFNSIAIFFLITTLLLCVVQSSRRRF